jgi:hypothetical protein
MAFLHSQADQIRKVIIDTQDESFFFLPVDARDGSMDMIPSVYHVTGTQGVGLMYKVVEVPGAFRLLKDHSFGGKTVKIRITIEDSFTPENSGSVVVHFTDGLPEVKDGTAPWDVEIVMDVAEFSSMLVGAVGFESLYTYGLAEISDVIRSLWLTPVQGAEAYLPHSILERSLPNLAHRCRSEGCREAVRRLRRTDPHRSQRDPHGPRSYHVATLRILRGHGRNIRNLVHIPSVTISEKSRVTICLIRK